MSHTPPARYQFIIAPGTGITDPSNAGRGLLVKRIRVAQVGVPYATQMLDVQIKAGGDNRQVYIPSGQARDITPFPSNILYGLSVSSAVAGNILVEVEGEWL